jgi:nucleotide-binding universal stress UspA family protein
VAIHPDAPNQEVLRCATDLAVAHRQELEIVSVRARERAASRLAQVSERVEMLIVGASRACWPRRLARPTTVDQLVRHTGCTVLVVPDRRDRRP